MNLYNFIVYFNKNTGKLEEVHNIFAQEFKSGNGQIKSIVYSVGHESLFPELKKRNIPLFDTIFFGNYSEKDGFYTIEHLRLVNNFNFNNTDVIQKAKEKGISIIDERKYFSSIIMDFILGVVKEENLKNLLNTRLYNFKPFLQANGAKDISLFDNQKTR